MYLEVGVIKALVLNNGFIYLMKIALYNGYGYIMMLHRRWKKQLLVNILMYPISNTKGGFIFVHTIDFDFADWHHIALISELCTVLWLLYTCNTAIPLGCVCLHLATTVKYHIIVGECSIFRVFFQIFCHNYGWDRTDLHQSPTWLSHNYDVLPPYLN